MNAVGDISTVVAPTQSGCSTFPIRPWSWNRGAHPTTVESRSCPKAVRIISWFAARFPCETITPFGAEVEPDVYCRKARSSTEQARGISSVGRAPSAIRSAASASGAPLVAASSGARVSRIASTVSTTAGAQSRTMLRVASETRPRRGGATGTATTPA